VLCVLTPFGASTEEDGGEDKCAAGEREGLPGENDRRTAGDADQENNEGAGDGAVGVGADGDGAAVFAVFSCLLINCILNAPFNDSFVSDFSGHARSS